MKDSILSDEEVREIRKRNQQRRQRDLSGDPELRSAAGEIDELLDELHRMNLMVEAVIQSAELTYPRWIELYKRQAAYWQEKSKQD